MNLPSQSAACEPPVAPEHPHPPAMAAPRTSSLGFTLVELIVVTAIIAILVVLTMPAINGIVGRANSIKCVSNLRQIGTGMALYVSDHDGRLPGPLSGAQHAMYFALSPGNGRLSMHLQGYISPDIPASGGNMISPLFVCPSFARVIKIDGSAQPYSTTGKITMKDGTTINAFGLNPGSSDPDKPPTPGAPIASISGGKSNLCNIVAIQDQDKDLSDNFGTSPPHPVHPTYQAIDHASNSAAAMNAHKGSYRNALFFDFHVGRVNLDGTPK